MEARRDDVLMPLLVEAATYDDFLDYVFGFLHRRSFFFEIATTPNLSDGLPRGAVRQVVLNKLNKYAQIAARPPNPSEGNVAGSTDVQSNKIDSSDGMPISSDRSRSPAFGISSWTQTAEHVVIDITITDCLSRSHLLVNIMPQEVIVKSRLTGTVYMEGELYDIIEPGINTWTLNGTRFQIHLTKARQCWWESPFQSRPTAPLPRAGLAQELGGEAEANVDQVTQSQQRQGLRRT